MSSPQHERNDQVSIARRAISSLLEPKWKLDGERTWVTGTAVDPSNPTSSVCIMDIAEYMG